MSRATVILLLLFGCGVGWVCWAPTPDVASLLYAGAAGLALLLPATRSMLRRTLERLGSARPSRIAVALFLIATAELSITAAVRPDYHRPKLHDEQSYYLQSLMLASGRLWEPAPAAPDSFESFHMITRPVYASIYPPGTALLHVADIWATRAFPAWPYWLTSVLLSAACVPVAFAALRLVGGNGLGAVGALALLASVQFRVHSTLVMSHVPALLFGTGLLVSAASLRAHPARRRAVLCGAVAGLLLITRPQDAACFLPGAVLLAFPARRWFGWSAAAMLPFVALLLVQNVGTTGLPLRSPYVEYTADMQPGTGLFASTPTTRPATLIRQKVDYVERFSTERGARYIVGRPYWPVLVLRAAMCFAGSLPSLGLVALLPLGLWFLARRPASATSTGAVTDASSVRRPFRAALLLTLGLFACVYGCFTFFLPHYVLPYAVLFLAPLVAVGAAARWARSVVAVALLAATLSALPETNPAAHDESLAAPTLELADRVEASLPPRPALLLFTYAGDDFQHEPVYNLRHAAIADHAVIRAHDLGPELNARLYAAYPDREVYVFDRGTHVLRDLGLARSLAHPTPPASPTSQPAP